MAEEWVSLNFRKAELACPCCGLYNMDAEVIRKIQRIRSKYGGMRINSGSRCPKHNTEVGGTDQSAHLIGVAVDVQCANSFDRMRLLQMAFEEGVRGVGIKPMMVHLDWAPRHRDSMWLYATK